MNDKEIVIMSRDLMKPDHENTEIFEYYESQVNDSGINQSNLGKVCIYEELNSVFGPYGWSFSIEEIRLLKDPVFDKKSKSFDSIAYARVRLEIHPTGDVLSWRSGSDTVSWRSRSAEECLMRIFEEAERSALFKAALGLRTGRKTFSNVDSQKITSEAKEEKFPWLSPEDREKLTESYRKTDPCGEDVLSDLLRQSIEEDCWSWACERGMAKHADGMDEFVQAGFEDGEIKDSVTVNEFIAWMNRIKKLANDLEEIKASKKKS